MKKYKCVICKKMSTGFGNNPAPISFIFRSEVDTMARDFTRVTPMPKSEARNKLKDYIIKSWK